MQSLPALWALGTMSGTSMDGVDAALIQTDGHRILEEGHQIFIPYPVGFRQELRALLGQKTASPQSRVLEGKLTHFHMTAIQALQERWGREVDLIGLHGHTISHHPPHTWQLGDGPWLSQQLKIPVVYRFRHNDCAHGGQGAPLVPVYHEALCRALPKPAIILNIGGVANITMIVSEDTMPVAFDTGPGNALMDDCMQRYFQESYDAGGQRARQGVSHQNHIASWLTHSYFAQQPPKSLDRHDFAFVLNDIAHLSPVDQLATLTQFTAHAIIQGIQGVCLGPPATIYVSGGGVHNTLLMDILQQALVPSVVCSIQEIGYSADFLEAQAFAFLAVRRWHHLPISFPTTTGVPHPVTGGDIAGAEYFRYG